MSKEGQCSENGRLMQYSLLNNSRAGFVLKKQSLLFGKFPTYIQFRWCYVCCDSSCCALYTITHQFQNFVG